LEARTAAEQISPAIASHFAWFRQAGASTAFYALTSLWELMPGVQRRQGGELATRNPRADPRRGVVTGKGRNRKHLPAQDDQRYAVEVTSTVPRFGGLRWWFVCPLSVNGNECGRRVGKLYLPDGARYFGCRRCHDLVYRSSQEARKPCVLLAMIAARAGCSLREVNRVLRGRGRG
jgi:hypothetical protein